MVLLYLLIGGVVYASYDVAPAETLRDMQPGSRARRRDVLLAVTVWCVGLAVWPLAVILRAVENVRRRAGGRARQLALSKQTLPAPGGGSATPRNPHTVNVYTRNEGHR